MTKGEIRQYLQIIELHFHEMVEADLGAGRLGGWERNLLPA